MNKRTLTNQLPVLRLLRRESQLEVEMANDIWARRLESDPFAARKVIHLGA